MNNPEIWIVRHGETEWSRDRKHTGRTDVPLLPEGEDGARAVAPRLAGVDFDLVLSSPLHRALRTAQLAGFEPQVEPEAAEWDYGDYEGVTTAEIRQARPDWSVWTDDCPDGESIDDVAARADKVLTRIRTESTDRALLFAHGHFLRVMTTRWIGVEPPIAQHFRLEPTTISVLGWDRGSPVIQRWNA